MINFLKFWNLFYKFKELYDVKFIKNFLQGISRNVLVV